MSDPGGRRILPQSAQMQSFTFAPQSFGPRENQKNYVFVDEHNRHKRLKVMRACEGCRRRKIKCDAATTNTWPCSACIRLKLHCVPPMVHYDRDYSPQNQLTDGERPSEYNRSSGSDEDDYHHHASMHEQLSGERRLDHDHIPQVSYAASVGVYQTSPYIGQPTHLQHHNMPLQYSTINTSAPAMPDVPYPTATLYATPPPQALPQNDSNDGWQNEQYNSTNLSEALGQLAIDEIGLAPYISDQKKSLAETPAFAEYDEYKHSLPEISVGPDLTVRIPPELMPSDEQALQFFDIFFIDIHPYIPVINKAYFYQQWHTDRASISPLILEGIFSCAGRMSNDPSQGSKWLAIAAKHEDCFNDVPRLSTIQAMLLLLKARESAPKRGYYYRSWMTIVKLIAMAQDLGLHEHYALHQAGKPCGSTIHDCVTKTQVWQTLFIIEVMVGGPQGRYEYAVEMDTVDINAVDSVPGLDETESIVHRNFTHFAKLIMRLRRMNAVSLAARRKGSKDWAMDPEFIKMNAYLEDWLTELPPDMQINYPADGSAPWIPTHYIGNLHAYYNLIVVICRRPQLALSDSYGVDGNWKQHMAIAYSAAKRMCRVQEGIHEQFGLTGLLCMLRGVNFSIYSILTCTVLHLVALTCPDRELNADAKDFFTRHVRILEKCSASWPMPEVRAQIDALREAFSADTSKPFTLKATFPYPSPRVQSLTTLSGSPVQDLHYHQVPRSHAPQENTGHITYTTHNISPSMGTGNINSKTDSPAVQSLVMLAAGQQRLPMSSAPIVENLAWNPTRIFDQWNTAFGQTPPPTQPSGPQLLRFASQDPNDMPHIANGLQSSANSSPMSQTYTPVSRSSNFVTPSMWQDSVAAVYGDGLKRRWDY